MPNVGSYRIRVSPSNKPSFDTNWEPLKYPNKHNHNQHKNKKRHYLFVKQSIIHSFIIYFVRQIIIHSRNYSRLMQFGPTTKKC